MTRSEHAIAFVTDGRWGRLKYFGSVPTEEFWDERWNDLRSEMGYTRALRGHLPHQLRRTFLRWVPPGARVVEAGCGLAHFTVAARAKGYAAEGFDFAPQVVAMLARRFPDIPFFQADARNLSAIPEGTYDAVFSPGVCEHFEAGPQRILEESHRILKPGGIAIVSTPCFNILRRFLTRLGWFTRRATGEFFQYAFSPDEMRTILEEVGFDVVQMTSYGALKTLMDHFPVPRLKPGRTMNVVAFALDHAFPFSRFGHSMIWVARKT